jgi:RNA polymerase sigma factor (TIGR02999 family)
MEEAGEVTQLLEAWRAGNAQAPDQLFNLLYRDLHARAHSQRRRAWSTDTLDTTALVHESYLKLLGQSQTPWKNHTHFLAVASTAMRHIIINYAKRGQADKRGGNWQQVTYDEGGLSRHESTHSLLAIEQALVRLDRIDPRLARIVEYRFFGGLTESEIARVLEVTERTVRREWRKAKAVLASALQADEPRHTNCYRECGH